METKERLFIGVIGIFLFSSFAFSANAADLFFSPSSGSYGGNFSVSVFVSSTNQSMNAASSTILFPKDKLQVTSISKNDSIFTFWAQNPSYSNSSGNISFEGIVFDPGYIGANGKLITINFKVKSAGSATVKFFNRSVLDNEGKATAILNKASNANFTLLGPSEVTPSQNAFTVSEISRDDPTDPVAKFSFNYSNPSDVDHYEIQIDNDILTTWVDDGSHIYHTVPLDPGNHFIFVKAFDKSGNFLEGSTNFSISPLPTPTITFYPTKLKSGDAAFIIGKAVKDSTVTLFLQKYSENPTQLTTKSDQEGVFIFNASSFKNGRYVFWVTATDYRGAKSNPSAKLIFSIEEPFNILILIILILLVLIILLLLILIALLILIHRSRETGWKRIKIK